MARVPIVNDLLGLLSKFPTWLLPYAVRVLARMLAGDADGAAQEAVRGARRVTKAEAAKRAIRAPLRRRR